MHLRRMETAVFLSLLVLLGIECVRQLMDASLEAPPTPSNYSFFRHLIRFVQRNRFEVKNLAGVGAMSIIAGLIVVYGDTVEKHGRRGATSGLLLGCLSIPLVFSCQLVFHSHLFTGAGRDTPGANSFSSSIALLFWLSLCCSIQAIVHAYWGSAGETSGDGVNSTSRRGRRLSQSQISVDGGCATLTVNHVGTVMDASGPGIVQLFTALALAQVAVLLTDGQCMMGNIDLKGLKFQSCLRIDDGKYFIALDVCHICANTSVLPVLHVVLVFLDILVVCFFFVYLLHFLLHRLPFSFTAGEARGVGQRARFIIPQTCLSVFPWLFY